MRIIYVVPLVFAMATVTSVCRADYTFYYTGQGFGFYTAPYTSSDAVTGWVTLSDSQYTEFTGEFVPEAFSYTDGIQTIDSSNATSALFAFYFYLGSPLIYQFELAGSTGTIADYTGIDQVSYTELSGMTGRASSCDDCFGNFGYPIYSAPVPEPSTLALISSGLLVVVNALWRRLT